MDRQEFIDECLREHNKYRILHGVAPLRHSIHLDKTAQEWAEDLVVKENLQNSPISSRGEVGENISMRKSTMPSVTMTGLEVAKQWYDDSKNYDFTKGIGAAGNFTQMVWKSTEEVGFGIAHHKGKCIVVGHYKPPGNVKNNCWENVKPLLSSQMAATSINSNDPNVAICPCPPKPESIQDQSLSLFMTPLSHSRSSSMSSDEHFEIMIQDDLEKAAERKSRQFIRETVKAINKYRVKHRVGKLKHNKELDDLAQKWAQELAGKSTLSNSNNHYKGDRVGENIASRWSNGKCDYTADQVADHWYLEHGKFSFDKEPPNVQGIGNFSQMVWKSSREIGIGKCIINKENDCRVIVVCNYYPAGNIMKQFLKNVLPASE